MFMVTINQDKCVGCASCVDACPAKILGMVDDKADVIGDAADCMGCETCVGLCPNECFTIMEL
ncbi:4Fe-4S ferredoxin iron-sulfur binding domain-containing protein [Desulfotomaculum nigrificans CO-1-SRB]|uniref:4Fe-4S ferredoxin iron-sulfur binding domain-containing protein n=1 Tax=Desulfotomaculum nigrificans (strain DSM 14880 / VKM B-2319 / CO-1-SRB) TaxID=868595 RepID=F6B4A0_DESCC|nr:4Fe-4S dicluster domain-containing protein [Desulfotomaculum nigrificans]AEF95277.1 4Fe-4S ferredoxin iron-sulfur binding domain-containing protein [Desulfotomaculum nigrificans CO-1-SRB]